MALGGQPRHRRKSRIRSSLPVNRGLTFETCAALSIPCLDLFDEILARACGDTEIPIPAAHAADLKTAVDNVFGTGESLPHQVMENVRLR